MLGETKNQFSLTRVASSTCGRMKSKFLSVLSDIRRCPAVPGNVLAATLTLLKAFIPMRHFLICYLAAASLGPASVLAQPNTNPPVPWQGLTPSGPVVASANGQIISNLLITATGSSSVAVNLNGRSNVAVKNCYIQHQHIGLLAQGCLNPNVDHCAFVRTPVPARGAGDSEADGVQFNGCTGTNIVVSNCEFWQSSVGVYLVNNAAGAHVFNINGYNMMGPMPRGQLVQANNSQSVIIEDFYNFNDLNVSWTEDNINLYKANNAIIRRGCVDGNNSPSGCGVIFDGSGGGILGGLVENVDALHQGNGAFSAYGATNTSFNNVRTRDGHNTGVGGRAKPSSNGLSFSSYNGSSGTTLVGQYHNPANAGNLIYDTKTYASWTIADVNFVARGPIALTGMPYAVVPSLVPPVLTYSVSNGMLNLSWATDHLGYRLLVQTNILNQGVSSDLNDWGTVVGSTGTTTTNLTIFQGILNEYYQLVYP